jgi:hypothetical protein
MCLQIKIDIQTSDWSDMDLWISHFSHLPNCPENIMSRTVTVLSSSGGIWVCYVQLCPLFLKSLPLLGELYHFLVRTFSEHFSRRSRIFWDSQEMKSWCQKCSQKCQNYIFGWWGRLLRHDLWKAYSLNSFEKDTTARYLMFTFGKNRQNMANIPASTLCIRFRWVLVPAGTSKAMLRRHGIQAVKNIELRAERQLGHY